MVSVLHIYNGRNIVFLMNCKVFHLVANLVFMQNFQSIFLALMLEYYLFIIPNVDECVKHSSK